MLLTHHRAQSRTAHWRSAIVLLFAVFVVAACSASDGPFDRASPQPRTEEAPQRAASRASAPFDLHGVMRQVHFAFRPEEGGWNGGHHTYETRADPSGFAVTPVAAVDDLNEVEPARFETVTMARGSEEHALPRGEGRIGPDGHLALHRGEVVEHLRNDEDGVEQSFELAAPLEGSGDLSIRVRVTGQAYAGETDAGHHFVDLLTGFGVRYGAATWVDALGARAPLAVTWNGSELVIVVPASIVESAAYPAIVDPTVGPEFPIDQPVTLAASGDQSRPSVASDGIGWFVVWTDQRISGSHMVVGARVSASGAVLDPGGVVLAPAFASTLSPSTEVAFDGTNYLVALANYQGSFELRVARVSAAGVPIDAAPGILVAPSIAGLNVSLAYGGGTYVLAWSAVSSTPARYEIRAVKISPAGVVGAPFTVSNSPASCTAPSVSYGGTNFFFVWEDARVAQHAIYGARVTPTGTVLDTTSIAVASHASIVASPRVTFDGVDWFVVWTDQRLGNYDIYGARVSVGGVVLDPTGVPIAQLPGGQTLAAVAFDGINNVVVWEDYRSGTSADVYAARVDTAGVVVDVLPIAVTTGTADEERTRLACGGTTCLVIWEDKRAGTTADVYGARFSGGVVLDPAGILVSSVANEEANPAVAFDGSNFFVVWQDYRAGSTADIYGARVTPTGAVLDPSGIVISMATGTQQAPRLAWMAPNYFVAWNDNRSPPARAYGARVTAAGTVLDSAGISLSPERAGALAVAADGANYVVAWCDARSNGPGAYAARITPGGASLDPNGIALANYATECSDIALAFDGQRYLAVHVFQSKGYAQRATPGGVVLDPTPLGLGTIQVPRVAFDGMNFLAAYQKNGIYVSRISSAGVLLDPSGVAVAPSTSVTNSAPALACDGSVCFVAWLAGTAYAPGAVYGGFVSQSATALNPGGFVIAPASTHLAPAVSTDGAGHWLVPYQSRNLYPPYGTYRIDARIVDGLGAGAPCSTTGECLSGYCVDGVCCNLACGGGSTTNCYACSAAAGASANGVCTALSGTACSDGNACTQSDVCQGGVCVGSDPVICTPTDTCKVAGSCDPSSGTCSSAPKADGTGCDDGNACTQSDTCQSGACTGASPVTCPVADACHVVAPCDPTAGTCAVTPKPDGTGCSDGDACTQGDTCQSGACVGGTPVSCTALDACHVAGTCDPATGQCSTPSIADGTPCNDGNACTQSDTCQGGACTGETPVSCVALDECHEPGTCDPSNGQCSSPKKPDGAPCSTGTCQGGVCTTGGAGGTGGGTSTSSSSSGAGGSTSSSSSGAGGSGGSTSSSSSGAGGSGGGASASSSGAGAGGMTGSSSSGGGPAESSGCGCRAAGGDDRMRVAPLVVLVLAAIGRRRRRGPVVT